MGSLYISIGDANTYYTKVSFAKLIAKLILNNVSKALVEGFDNDNKSICQLSNVWLEGGIYLDTLSTSQFQEVVSAMVKGYQFLDSIMDNENLQEEFVENRIGTGQPVKTSDFIWEK